MTTRLYLRKQIVLLLAGSALIAVSTAHAKLNSAADTVSAQALVKPAALRPAPGWAGKLTHYSHKALAGERSAWQHLQSRIAILNQYRQQMPVDAQGSSLSPADIPADAAHAGLAIQFASHIAQRLSVPPVVRPETAGQKTVLPHLPVLPCSQKSGHHSAGVANIDACMKALNTRQPDYLLPVATDLPKPVAAHTAAIPVAPMVPEKVSVIAVHPAIPPVVQDVLALAPAFSLQALTPYQAVAGSTAVAVGLIAISVMSRLGSSNSPATPTIPALRREEVVSTGRPRTRRRNNSAGSPGESEAMGPQSDTQTVAVAVVDVDEKLYWQELLAVTQGRAPVVEEAVSVAIDPADSRPIPEVAAVVRYVPATRSSAFRRPGARIGHLCPWYTETGTIAPQAVAQSVVLLLPEEAVAQPVSEQKVLSPAWQRESAPRVRHHTRVRLRMPEKRPRLSRYPPTQAAQGPPMLQRVRKALRLV